MRRRVLVVEAHPDDIEWYAGGTIAGMARQGAEITLVICTEGERGSYDPEADPAAIAAARKREQRASAELLGVSNVVYLGYPDGGLEATAQLRKRLAVLYRQYKPELLLAFDPWKRYEPHPDHVAAGKAAVEARLFAKMPLYYAETRSEGIEEWAVPEVWLFNTDDPNHYVDVTDTFDARLAALRLHAGQNVWGPDSVRYLTGAAVAAAEKLGCKYAEGFHRIMIEGAIARS
ncbi:MAG: PIG-L deacetylase family protein [Rudaea sp.]